MKYKLLAGVGEAPRSTCTVCTGPTAGPFLIILKLPRGGYSVLCDACALATCASIPMMHAVELATTLEWTLPQVSAWFIRYGVFEIPLTSQGIDEALGLPVGFTRGVWSDR